MKMQTAGFTRTKGRPEGVGPTLFGGDETPVICGSGTPVIWKDESPVIWEDESPVIWEDESPVIR